MGADRTPIERTSFDAWSRSIAVLASKQSEPAILVGHSRGSIVISQAAEYAPDAIRTTAYLAAMLVPHGAGMMDMFGPISTTRPRRTEWRRRRLQSRLNRCLRQPRR